MIKLEGRSTLVTGAGRGFGRAIAMALAGAGAKVTLVARTAEQIGAVAEEIRAAGGIAHAVVSDVGDVASIRDAYAQHVAAYGPTTILVSCAGVSDPVGPIGEIDAETWWRTMNINVRAPLQLMSLAVPDMRRAGRGTVINVGSIAGLAVIPFNSGYSVSKATLQCLSQHVAAEQKDHGIAVFPVHPGIAFTRLMQDSLNDDMRQWLPGIADHFAAIRESPDAEPVLRRCADHCVALASGRHDELSGKFLNLSVPDLAQAVVTGSAPAAATSH